MNLALWAVAGILAGMYMYAGVLKAFQYEKAKGQLKWPADLPKGLVAFIGISELLAGIGLVLPPVIDVLPWLATLAAAGLSAVMLLAAGFHAKRGEYQAVAFTLTLAGLAVFVAYGRWQLVPF
jgi:hypothetical protein